jgi:hypothetical protein
LGGGGRGDRRGKGTTRIPIDNSDFIPEREIGKNVQKEVTNASVGWVKFIT